MPTLQDQNNRLDPEQQEYERNFDFERHERELQQTSSSGRDNPAERANMDRAQAWSHDTRPIAEQEAAPSWDTNLANRPDQGREGGESSGLNQMLKKRATKWIIGGVVSAVFAAGVAVPAVLGTALVNLKELSHRWGNNNTTSGYSKYSSRYLQKKLFQADPNCNEGVKCRYSGGVSDKEIDEFKKQGLNPEVQQNGDKKFIKAFHTTDAGGNPVVVDANNFDLHYSTNPTFRGHMDKIAKPGSMLMRGKQTLKLVFDKFSINRKDPVGDSPDEKETERAMRKTEYSEENRNIKVNDAPASDKQGTPSADIAVNEGIQQAADAQQQSLADNNWDKPPSVVPDTTGLDSGKFVENLIGDVISGGLGGATKGIFAGINTACSGYQMIRAVIFGAKIYKAIQLIKYAGIFMTLADKIKAGDAGATEIAFIMTNVIFKPSSKPESLGKTFFQSEGWNVISQGKVADHRGLARWTNASPFLKAFQSAQSLFQTFGANKTSCGFVKSWYGQVALTIAGLTTDIFTGGAAAVQGAITNTALRITISFLEDYAVPLLIQYAAGTVAPDSTDAEGGYGAGNAFAAGTGAMGLMTGKVNGMRVLTKQDAETVSMETAKETAFMDAADNQGGNPFAIDNPESITSKLAFALAPYAATPLAQTTFQGVASMFTSPFSLVGSSIGSLVNHGADAAADISGKAGEFCTDEDYNSMGLALDAFCNPIPGEKNSVINDPRYAPGLVEQYMANNNYIDKDGNPQDGDYKKYLDSCVDSTAPISPDGGGSDVTENIDTRWCIDPRDEFNMFRAYIAYTSIDSSYKDSINQTLGQDQ